MEGRSSFRFRESEREILGGMLLGCGLMDHPDVANQVCEGYHIQALILADAGPIWRRAVPPASHP
jgi:hypothetical protein